MRHGRLNCSCPLGYFNGHEIALYIRREDD
jgi:hypothetical protein